MTQIIVLRAVYDDSDSMTDYYSPDRSIEEWFICEMPGKRLSEKKLWDALKRLPSWIWRLKWEVEKEYQRDVKLRSEYFKELEIRSYGGYDRCLGFLISRGYASIFEMNHKRDNPAPRSYEDFRRFVEFWKCRREDRLEELKRRSAEAHAKTILNSHAIIGANGFEVLTPKKRIEKILEIDEVRQILKTSLKNRDKSKEILEL